MIYLITGKAGAGKTHYSKALAKELIDEGVKVVVLDGDEFRDETKNDDFSDEGRRRNLLGAAKIAADLEAQGFTVYADEWWHFDHKDWAEYPILNETFAELGSSRGER